MGPPVSGDDRERKIMGGDAVPLLFGDNKGATQLTKGVSTTSKIKHIDVLFHHIVDEAKQGGIKVSWVPGEYMVADGMTKTLPREAFERHRAGMGITTWTGKV